MSESSDRTGPSFQSLSDSSQQADTVISTLVSLRSKLAIVCGSKLIVDDVLVELEKPLPASDRELLEVPSPHKRHRFRCAGRAIAPRNEHPAGKTAESSKKEWEAACQRGQVIAQCARDVTSSRPHELPFKNPRRFAGSASQFSNAHSLAVNPGCSVAPLLNRAQARISKGSTTWRLISD